MRVHTFPLVFLSGNTGNSGNTARKPAEILGFSVATWRKHQKTAVATLATDANPQKTGLSLLCGWLVASDPARVATGNRLA